MRKETGREERKSKLASGWTVESEPDAPVVANLAGDANEDAAVLSVSEGDAETDQTSQMSNGALVVLGVLGGLYLLYTWVWFSWADFYSDRNAVVAQNSGSIGFVLQQLSYWAAPIAPALWFLAAVLMGRKGPTWRLAMWLLIGAVVLVPLPMFGSIGGA